MPVYFFDTSALAKAYRHETGTQKVMALLAELGSQHWVSSLTVVEFQSVFAQKVRGGELTLAEYQLLRRKFGGEIRAKRLIVKGLLRRHQRAAEKLIATHAPTMRPRTLDALQLAMALELKSSATIDEFVVADEHLAQVAGLEGLSVINPNDP
jgi:predicted nucleic acid-binding protein